MNQDVGNRFSQNDMNRLNQLKFNPFGYNDNIALCDNNTNLDISLETKNIKCDYYLPRCDVFSLFVLSAFYFSLI